MKVVQAQLFERGDHVQVIAGYNKGRVGQVIRHENYGEEVFYKILDKDYDDDDMDDEYEESPAKYLKFLSNSDYAAYLKKNNILIVEGLPVNIQYKNKSFIIGDNVVTSAEAKKLADFINQYTKPAKKKA